jgi:intracellular multiplication protein IcmK
VRARTAVAAALACLAACLPLQARAQAQLTIRPSQADVEADLDRQAQGVARRRNLPLTPEMIDDLARAHGQVREAQERAGQGSIALPVTRSVNIPLGPGGATPILQAVQGFPTAIAFMDSTGQPWPIIWDTNSNPNVDNSGFDVSVPEKGSNVMQIIPRSPVPRGGLLVYLKGAPVPLTFMVIAGRDRYDARVDARVADRGPNAKVQIITRPNTPETGAAYLTAMLDGTPPAEAVPLVVSGVSPDEVRAWRMGGRVYLRTRYTLISPEWVASEAGPSGVSIYALPATPIVLLSANGRSVSARLTEH